MNSYILVADVLGFSRIVTNLAHDQLDERLSVWVSLVEEIRVEVGIEHAQLISDTIFVREDDCAEGLERLLRYSQLLLERGLRQSFPIRGAISRGDLRWGTLTYGKALIRGHELERQQDWIGISCEPTLSDVPWSWDLVCCYPVPKKRGSVQLCPAVVWEVPEAPELMRRCIGEGLLSAGEHFTWELHSKLSNTLFFSRYVRKGREHRSGPEHYRQEFSADLI